MDGELGSADELQNLRQRVRDLETALVAENQRLEAANQSLLKERSVLQRLLDLHDRDRQLIAYEIHDGIVQDMTAALMFFETAAESLREKGQRAAEHYLHGIQLLRSSIHEARRLINGLRPPVLDEFGLIDAIGNHIEELRSQSAIEIDFEHDVQFTRLAPVVETAIYRIVQEALNNLWQHSRTQRAAVSIHQRDQHVEIVVRDWGRGFDPGQVKPKRFGLLSIRDRARLLGGEALIASAPDQGTTVRVSLPVTDVLLPNQAGGQ